MDSRARVLGQPVNPVLMLLPLGILSTATIADLGALLSGLRLFGAVAQADVIVGLVAGGFALCALLVDFVTAPARSVAREVLALASLCYGGMVAIFLTVCSVRAADGTVGNAGLFLLELVALAGGVAAARLAHSLGTGRGRPTWAQSWRRQLTQGAMVRVSRLAPRTWARFSATRLARFAPATLVATQRLRTVPAPASYDPDATVVLFGLASSTRRS